MQLSGVGVKLELPSVQQHFQIPTRWDESAPEPTRMRPVDYEQWPLEVIAYKSENITSTGVYGLIWVSEKLYQEPPVPLVLLEIRLLELCLQFDLQPFDGMMRKELVTRMFFNGPIIHLGTLGSF